MFELRVRSSFAAAHRLNDYVDKCSRLHGHTWEVEVVVAGPELNNAGMLVDFSRIKKDLRQVLDGLDHGYLNDLPPFADFDRALNPTAENIARHIFVELKGLLAGCEPHAALSSVTVWESPTAAATYREE